MDELLKYDDTEDYGLLEQARQGFIRKVYLIVTCQLVFTFAVAGLAGNNPGFQAFQAEHFWLMILAIVGAIVTEIVIFCGGGRNYPSNYIYLSIFTVCESYLLTGLVSHFFKQGKGELVLAALAATALLVGGLTLIAYANCLDLTGMSGVMGALSMGVMVLALLGLFFGGGGIISGLLVLLFGVFLVYDTQMIMGKGEQALSTDDYVIGALIIYIDVIVIFSELLKLFGGSN